MSDEPDPSGTSSDDMSEFLQMFIDETEEQLEDLVETMLLLERDPDSSAELNEAFRLIHSIKGSAGMMGFDGITALTHHLEGHFVRLRSGLVKLDPATMNLVLRCIDFLRDCTGRLRGGEDLGSVAEFLDELSDLPKHGGDSPQDAETTDRENRSGSGRQSESGRQAGPPTPLETAAAAQGLAESDKLLRVTICFEADLPLADLKARLIVSRLSGLGDLKSTRPDLGELEQIDDFTQFVVVIDSERSTEEIQAAVNVDGVASIDVVSVADQLKQTADESSDEAPAGSAAAAIVAPSEVGDDKPATEAITAESEAVTADRPGSVIAAERGGAKVGQTMRVDIDRLDNLMNLAGELVVNRARFVQVYRQLRPALEKANVIDRIRDFGDSLRGIIDHLKTLPGQNGEWTAQIQELRAGLRIIEEQSDLWETSRRQFGQITEAIDQLTRVSDNLQRGMLGTRMVPVAPLFNRFRRVVRDLSQERGKRVNLRIRGEKTELDKRMIDELGDPLVHLVRNSIDHGLESTEDRVKRGKPDLGTIFLEASHSGNNVYIHVRDDGAGINLDKIKQRLVEHQVLSATAVEELSDEQLTNYIWHPGFSTASEITDVSGRGVGMDVVKTRINDLNGTIDIQTVPGEGTSFSLRLPLTLAIITSLLVRIRGVTFCIPIDDVREIVSLGCSDIVSVRGKQTFDIRGEFMPLVGIENVFCWHNVRYRYPDPPSQEPAGSGGAGVDVVILQSGGSTMGLRVDELLGSQDIVIKSLSENFVDIRGLSGASILGDGTVCLMLDVAQVINMATSAPQTT